MAMSTFFALTGLLGVSLVLGACPAGWMHHGAKCYKFQIEKQNWVDARTMCKWHKSDLIAIETPQEQAWFKKQALTFNQTDGDDGFWLGATNWAEDDKWVWESANNAPATYIVWGANQPNNRNNSEKCLAALKYFDYVWSDEFCDWDRLGYVCETSATATPAIG